MLPVYLLQYTNKVRLLSHLFAKLHHNSLSDKIFSQNEYVISLAALFLNDSTFWPDVVHTYPPVGMMALLDTTWVTSRMRPVICSEVSH
jgi:hypothetical protein